MDHLLTVHNNFLEDTFVAAKIDSNKISAIPSLLFLSSTFILVYSYFHKLTRNHSSRKAVLYRECGFHWVFFYITRLWFLMIKGGRCLVNVLEEYFQLSYALDDDCTFCISPYFTRGVIFSAFLLISLIPVTVLFLKWYCKQHIPDFLMWVAEDPWMRSEIGIAGHYLEHPPPSIVLFTKSKRKRFHQGMRKSTSADFITMRASMKAIRPSKSVQYPNRSSISL